MTQFHKLEPAMSRSAREATVRNICTALEIHAQLEEEIFYPSLRETGIDVDQLDKSVPEHDQMRSLIERVRSLDADDPAQAEAMCELMRTVMHHVAEEETQLLPLAEERLGDRLAELGAKMTERRMQLAKPHVGQMAADMARASPGKTALVVAGTVAAGALLLGGMKRGKTKHHA
ncbi:MAG: hemerythrin domain-containing protein [Comamonadaceae bacterium]|nr:hemerythrin domain-containing protein [Comamonadaceae bacterium]